jgi:hypothetical protein
MGLLELYTESWPPYGRELGVPGADEPTAGLNASNESGLYGVPNGRSIATDKGRGETDFRVVGDLPCGLDRRSPDAGVDICDLVGEIANGLMMSWRSYGLFGSEGQYGELEPNTC